MRNGKIVMLCTLLGFVTGIGISWFVSVQSGITFQVWVQDLIVAPTWEGWLVCLATILIPTLMGLRTGLKREDISGILLTPVFSLLAGAAALLFIGFMLMIMQNLEIYSFLGFVAVIGLLIPATGSIIVIIAGG